MPIARGTMLRDAAIAKMVDALMDGPQCRDELMRRAGIDSPVVFYNNLYRLPGVRQFKTRIFSKSVNLFWLDHRPAWRKEKTTDQAEALLDMRARRTPLKVIARELGVEHQDKAIHAMVKRYKEAAR